MEFYDESRHVARKTHKCTLCAENIEAGESYYQEKGKYDGHFFSRDLHTHCHNMEREFCEEVDNEFYWNDITDYIQDKYCGECEHAACNDDREDWTGCDFYVTKCPRIIKIFSEENKQ